MIDEKKRILTIIWMIVLMFGVSLIVFKLGNKVYKNNNENLNLGDVRSSCEKWGNWYKSSSSSKWTADCSDYSKKQAEADNESYYRVCKKETDLVKCTDNGFNAPCYSGYELYARRCTGCKTGYSLSNDQCSANCKQGSWSNNGSCETCPKGYSCNGVTKTLCESGYYQDEEGKNSCKKCPSGQISNNSRIGCYTPSNSGGSSNSCYKDADNNYYYGNYSNQSGYTKLSNSKETCNNIKVIKVDANGNVILGATIELEDKTVNPSKVTKYMIGEENINGLKKGTYEIKETVAPSNYQLDNSIINISVNSDGTISVTGTNVDLGTTNNTRSIVMKIKNTSNEEKCYVMPNNVYCYGKETDCGTNYVKTIDTKDKCNTITISKKDASNNLINGAVYVLENDNGVQINTFSMGETNINELAEGNYILKETLAPMNYPLDNSEIKITVSSDGNVTVTGESHISIDNNNTRGVSITIKNTSDNKKCYVNYGNGSDNTYCYGTSEECSNFKEALEGKDSNSCKEDDMCYKTSDGRYVTGKYSNQTNYTPSGNVCPACYKNTKGEYRWTNNPTFDETKDSSITNENMCVTSTSSSSSSILKVILIILIIVVIIILLLFKFNGNKNDNNHGLSTDE